MSSLIRCPRALSIYVLFTLSVVYAAPAHADKIVEADILFRSAKALSKEGKWAEACPKFLRSYELDNQLGVLANLANCYQEEGKIASAWARWAAALEWARRDRDSRQDFIAERVEELEPRLPKLLLEVDEPRPTGLSVRRAGEAVSRETYGLAVPVDPGAVIIEVLRGEEVLESQTAVAVEREVVTVRLDLVSIATRHPEGKTAVAPPAPQPRDEEPSEDEGRSQRIAGYAVGAVGLGALVVAGGLGIGALVKRDQATASDACANRFCSPAGLDAAEDASTFAEASQWVGIAGIGLTAIGATILLTAPSSGDDRAWTTSPWLGPEGGGMMVGGQF
ncbi:MAG: hypothetical protein AAGA56_14240 [Myxococcota bacterium]